MPGKKFLQTLFVSLPFILLLVVPFITHGQLIINEIQYNPAGTDGGYEWIELHNNGDAVVSVEDFSLRESDKNHRITQTNESLGWSIPTNGYAIIVDNPTKFLEKHPGFPGLLFDSSFTLVNTGELVELLNPDGELIFGFMYDPQWGGDGDGSTLGLLDTQWKSTESTPGRRNTLFITPINEPKEEQEDSTQQDNKTTTPQTNKTEQPISDIPQAYIQLQNPEYKEKTIKSDAGPDRTLLTGVAFTFTGKGYGLSGGILDTPEYVWNFGDGTKGRGKTTIHAYAGPGTYVVTLKIISGKYSHTDHFTATVVPPHINLKADSTKQLLTLSNQSPHTIEISGFSLQSGETKIKLPPESFIGPNSQIIFNAQTLGLDLSDKRPVMFLAQNGFQIARYHGLYEQIQKQITIQEKENTEPKTSSKDVSSDISEQKTEQQIVYIGVPQYIESETPKTTSAENISKQITQTAQLPDVITKELFTPFEYLLFLAFGLVASGFGLYKLREHLKREP